jgi:hypothetical protein
LVWPVLPSWVCWLDLTGQTGQGHRSDRCCPVSTLVLCFVHILSYASQIYICRSHMLHSNDSKI